MIFDYFDQAYLINMDKDTERLAKMSERFKRLGFPAERISAFTCDIQPKHPMLRPGAFGCVLSHLHIWLLMLERNQQRALIFEDDAVFRDDTSALLQNIIIPELKITESMWNWCYLGGHIGADTHFSSLTPHLRQALYADQTHAYIMKREAIRPAMEYAHTILANPVKSFDQFDGVPITRIFTIPILSIQEPIFSYSEEKWINRDHQYFPPFDQNDFKSNCQDATWLSLL